MKARVIQEAGPMTLAVIFETGDKVMAGLDAVAHDYDLAASHFTAIGAFRRATLGFFEWESKEYKEIPVEQQVEVLSLIGDIAREDGEPKIHAHVVLGCEDGSTRGGHLMEATVRPTLEVVIVESPAHLRRHLDPESGLALIQLH
ncbi:MAG TPA: PPC domain-containing DNA-binding protein [Thermomicrobiales bacterium]|nr:PPC domain-containing DNA-binding protein [Thermomicrobiales bacterium]